MDFPLADIRLEGCLSLGCCCQGWLGCPRCATSTEQNEGKQREQTTFLHEGANKIEHSISPTKYFFHVTRQIMEDNKTSYTSQNSRLPYRFDGRFPQFLGEIPHICKRGSDFC